MNSGYAIALLEKLPVLDLSWPEERQQLWWVWLEQLVSALNPTSSLRPG